MPPPLFPTPAAPLPGEADLLANVVADPADDTRRLVYADWLEEHDDPRGPFLRACVEAARAAKPLPDAAPFPRPWRDLAGVTLLDAIPRCHLARRRDAILRLARPTLGATTAKAREGTLPVGATKFGGKPDLPAGAEWPRRDKGPLAFVAQFNCADLARSAAGRALPAVGVLAFFVFSDHDAGLDGEGPDGHRVLYFPDPARLARRAPPRDIAGHHVAPACRVAVVEGMSLPCLGGPWDKALNLGTRYLARDRAVRGQYPQWAPHPDESFARFRRNDEYNDLRSALSDGAPRQHLLGYNQPYVVSGDPIPGSDWVHLLTLASDANLGWCWGDGDHLSWYVPAADLRAGRFDRAAVVGT